MKLPRDSYIAMEKLTHYLLKPQARGDKSAFLARAGYTVDQAETLLNDLRAQVLSQQAEEIEVTAYGVQYQIQAKLTGPSGRSLWVKTVWLTEHLSGVTKFITLVPAKEPITP